MNAFDRWAKAYRKTAADDEYREITARLEEEGYADLEGIGPRAVEATLYLVEVVAGYQDPNKLLPLQVYRAADVRSQYTLTFQGGRHELTRLYCDDIAHLDLVEIHDEGVGCQNFSIDRSDERAMTAAERSKLKAQVREDFDQDYFEGVKLKFSGETFFLQVEVEEIP
ncbi:MAG: hypothetical protein Q8M76_09300 [Spirochaetaceae bacterium]|nr:hypothetical protein [Spirochaetaceae bacterium]